MSESKVRVWRDGAVMNARFARTHKKNALDRSMYADAAGALAEAAADASVRAFTLGGDGDTFCAGNDLLDFMQAPPVDDSSEVWQFLLGIVDFPKPLLVAAHGAAVGIGTTMLLHVDLAAAAEGTRCQMPFVRLGLVPEAGSSLLIPAMAGHARAAELLMLGESFSPAEAREVGLINAVTADAASAEAWVSERAARLAALPPAALRETKALLKGPTREAVHAALRREAGHFAARLASPELAEAVTAFMTKREPDFSRFA
jgi:enoyl-CoA hydratase/carnithine racemase